jgi:spore coat polysaccharide biosynthesis protein SpsF (cytidylyltransferase family)
MTNHARPVAIIQARMASHRLPGKVLLPIADRPMLALIVERVRQAATVREAVVATSTDAADDPIAAWCAASDVRVVRGSHDDVLDRYRLAAHATDAAVIVRITADCPLSDPDVIDQVVDAFVRAGADYASNVHPPTFPDGFDVEVFSRAALERACAMASRAYQREHVTSVMTERPSRFRRVNVARSRDLSAWRLTVDEPEDLTLIRQLLSAWPAGSTPRLEEIVAWLETHPEACRINQHLTRNAAYPAAA